jgi:hypothetical protein
MIGTYSRENPMRMVVIALSLPLVVAATAPLKQPQAKPQIARKMCAPNGTTLAKEGLAGGGRMLRARPLSDMPPAKQILTVIRTVDGCDVPVIVRENIGG